MIRSQGTKTRARCFARRSGVLVYKVTIGAFWWKFTEFSLLGPWPMHTVRNVVGRERPKELSIGTLVPILFRWTRLHKWLVLVGHDTKRNL
jgi:hypothetical protein